MEYLEDFSRIDAILESARVGIYPDFVAPETRENVMEELWGDTVNNARRLLYVALTRAREKVILECPTHLDAKERPRITYWDVLRDAAGLELVANRMRIAGGEFDCRIVRAGKDSPPEFDDAAAPADTALPVIGRRAIVPSPLPTGLTPEALTPSSLHGLATEIPADIRTETYGEPLESRFPGIDALERGTLLHRCFEVLSGNPGRLHLLSQATGYPLDEDQTEAICQSVAAFDTWLKKTLKPVAVNAEVPLLVLNDVGSVVSGTMDLLVEATDGFWIIDHKSDSIDNLHEKFTFYVPQLKCYADSLAKVRRDKSVLGLVINWVTYGKVSVVKGENFFS